MLELKNITKTFGKVVANNDVSMKIEEGTIHAIVGENGGEIKITDAMAK